MTVDSILGPAMKRGFDIRGETLVSSVPVQFKLKPFTCPRLQPFLT
ncbi:MAG: hypothetical protein ICV80_15655 [Microcoleus sp. T1-bin1]|nr:hypothetical protein [Microcoleus sp. T1-bin1]